MKNLSKTNFIFISFSAVVVLGSVYLAIIAASRGSHLLQLEKKRLALEKQKSELTAELIAKSSLTEVSLAAEELGFAKPETIIYLEQGDSVAENSLKDF